jgi:peptidoglycan hydrolase-like protein with peptidoglycan-binding domain
MIKKRKIIYFLFLVMLFFNADLAEAISDKPETQAMLEQIEKLQKQISKLQLKILAPEPPFIFTKNLRLGSTGEEVSQLQKYLTGLPEIYPPGLVTGYFGALTEKAIKKFILHHLYFLFLIFQYFYFRF